MKKLFLYMVIVLVPMLTACSQDEDLQLTISQNELDFSANGGEQILNVESNFDWECDYATDWLLVRQQQNKVRIIVDENNNDENRSAKIQFLYEGDVRAEVVVVQEGVSLNVEDEALSVISMGENVSIPISCNTDWNVESSMEDWCMIVQETNSIKVSITRNYQMKERSSIITVKAGNIERNISITQSACQWFETFEMIEVEGGNFYMGAQKEYADGLNYDLQAYQIESPVHQVDIRKYAISKYEVTQQQWVAAMGYNPSTIQGDKLPVETVSWDQVQEFISALNEYSNLNYRLPTEAEWEFAAKGGVKTESFKYSGYSVIGACAWYYSNSESTTHEVGTKNPNELGIYDMTGNVREWCNDWFDYYTSSDVDNPQGPDYGDTKINRGGSWTTPAVNCRNSYRHTNFPNEASQDLGFRLVLAIE